MLRVLPGWGYKDNEDRAKMEHFITCIAEGMKRCVLKPINCGKIKETSQGRDENPTMFLAS